MVQSDGGAVAEESCYHHQMRLSAIRHEGDDEIGNVPGSVRQKGPERPHSQLRWKLRIYQDMGRVLLLRGLSTHWFSRHGVILRTVRDLNM